MTEIRTLIFILIALIWGGCKFANHESENSPSVPSAFQMILNDNQKANKFESEGKIDSAIATYDRLAIHYQKTRQWQAAIDAIIKSANLEKDRKNSRLMRQKALLADSLAKLFFPNNDSLKAEIIHQMGNAELIHGNYSKALEYFIFSKEIKEKLFGTNDTLLTSTYNSVGVSYFMQAQLDQALSYYQKALNLAKLMRTKSNKLIPRISENLGIIYVYFGNYDKAISYFSESIRLKAQIFGVNSVETGRAYANIANFYITLSNYDEAQENLLKAEKIFINHFGPEYKDLAEVYMNLGKIYNSRADYDKAQIYFNKSAQIMRSINPEYPGLRLINTNLGYIYFTKENYIKALSYTFKGISQEGNRPEDIKAYRNLARCYQSLGKKDSAMYFFRKSIELSESKAGNPYELGTSYLYLGEFYLKNNEHAKAREFFKKAFNLFDKIFGQQNRDRAYAMVKMGEVELAEGHEEKALQLFQRAIESWIPFSKSSDIIRVPGPLPQVPEYYLPSAFFNKALALRRIWEKTQDTTYLFESSRHLKAAITLTDRIRSTYSSEESIIQLSQNIRQYLELAMKTSAELYNLTHNEQYLVESFDYSDRSKSALLLLAFRDLDEIALGTVPRDVLDKERDLRNRIMGYKKLIYDQEISGNPNAAKVELWNGEIFKLERALELHIQQIRKNYPAYYARKYEGKTFDIQLLKKILTSKESLIEYTFADSTLYVFILNSEGLRVIKQKAPSILYQAVPEYLSAIQMGLTVDASTQFLTFTKNAYLFYEMLIKPYRDFFQPSHKLIVIPEGILNHLPFETFLMQPVNSKIPEYRNLPYLMEDYCIRYAYVATNLLIPEKTLAPKNNVVAFAPVTFKTNTSLMPTPIILYPDSLPDLPYSLEETKKIIRMTGGDLFDHEKANEASFKQIAAQYRVIHLATHTWIDTLNPLFSKFVMYNQPDSVEDNLISTYEISNLSLPASLVVLNSCNSGMGNTMAGEGVFNLARGFFYAGVPSVLATLWEVDDNIGSDIVQRFYKKLMKGVPADEALWESRREYLKDSDRLKSHPYFWSPYGFVGQSKIITIEKPARLSFLVLLTTGVIILAGLSKVYIRRQKRRRNLSQAA